MKRMRRTQREICYSLAQVYLSRGPRCHCISIRPTERPCLVCEAKDVVRKWWADAPKGVEHLRPDWLVEEQG